MKRFIIPAVIFIVAAVTAAIYFMTPSDEYVVYPAEGNKILIIDGEVITDYPPLFLSGRAYIETEAVSEYIDEDIFPEAEYGIISVVYNGALKRFGPDGCVFSGGKAYIDIDLITSVYPIRTFVSGTVLHIMDLRSAYQTSTVISKTRVRHGPGIKHPYMAILETGTEIYTGKTDGKWAAIWTENGINGYVRIREILPATEVAAIYPQETSRPGRMSGKRFFAWEMLYSPITGDSLPYITSAIDVVSPTWLSLKSKAGDIVNRISPEYSSALANSGVGVMPCVTNDFNSPEMTSAFLRDPFARERLAVSLLELCKAYGFVGINIDFENIYLSDKKYFTQFIRELYCLTGENGLTLTVCTGVTGGSATYSLVYDHAKLAEFSDALMLMSYDELPYSSPEHGPVASLSWTERKLLDLLRLVPADRVYLGIPLYTRVWKTEDNGKYSSIPVSLNRQAEILAENPEGSYLADGVGGQSVFRYEKNNTIYFMYLEDEEVIRKRLELSEEYGLAGVAFWAKNYAEKDFFEKLRH